MKVRNIRCIVAVLIAVLLLIGLLSTVGVRAAETLPPMSLINSASAIIDHMRSAVDKNATAAVVTITEQGFQPKILTVTVGSSVVWHNQTARTLVLRQGLPQFSFLPLILSSSVHGVVERREAVDTREIFTGTILPGDTFTYTFTQPGMIAYYTKLGFSLTGTIIVQVAPPDATSEIKAYQHLEEVMDKYHQAFDVYTDLAAGGNHFVHRAQLGSDVAISDGFTEVVHSGSTAILNRFTPTTPEDWGGWYFMVGMLENSELKPKDNWGEYPNAGYDLTGATELTFWARGAQGGERVEFFAFNVGRNEKGVQQKPYPDSEAKVTLCGRLSADCYITLTNTWQRYTIKLTGLDLHYVLGGFGWATKASENHNQAVTFYLDDIRYAKAQLKDPRFLLSFETIPSQNSFDMVMKNVSFVYDDALALMAFVKNKQWERAQLIADAFVYAQKHDRYYQGDHYDGRLRNAYQAGDLTTPPGWAPNGITGTVRLPGWWDPVKSQWVEDSKFVGTDTGNMAWVILALLTYYEARGGQEYLASAEALGNWINTNTFDTRGAGGFTGGYIGDAPNQIPMTWKSTEHNLDLTAAFERLYLLTGDMKWHERSLHARKFVEAMWNDGYEPVYVQRGGNDCKNKPIHWLQDQGGGFFSTGTLLDGMTPNKQAIPLDGQTWALMVLGRNAWTERAISYAEIHHAVTYTVTQQLQYAGFDFNEDRDLPWMEGTGQMVVAYAMLGEAAKSQYYLQELREIQATASNTNQKGVAASPVDGLTNGFDWCYFNRLHVGATAWFIFAEQRYNPYWYTESTPNIAPYSARITGSITGSVGISYPFTGAVVALTPPTFVTYEWQATEQADAIVTGNSTQTITYRWPTTGTKFITLTARTGMSISRFIHMIDIQTTSTPSPVYKLHGVDFGPYVDGRDPNQGAKISATELRSLITPIAPYTEWLRVYGCGDGLESAGQIAHSLNLKIAMGAWLSRDAAANEKQIACLIQRAQTGDADLVVVGSETLYRNDLTPAQLIEYIQRVKTALPNLPVTTADVYASIVDNPQLVNVVDKVLVNLYPYWEGIKLDDALALMHDRFQHVKALVAGKEVILSETGWPSCGNQIGDAIASPENAAYYFLNLVSWARANHVPYFYFAAYDEPWKAIYEGPQGACWGIWDRYGVMKPGSFDVFAGKTLPDNWSGTAIVGGPGTPTIKFISVPAYGTSDKLIGQIQHVAPGQYRVAVYIYVGGGWWLKPYLTQPQTFIYPDGHWVCNITTGGVDQLATEIVAYLIPVTYTPPGLLGATSLPAELDQHAVAKVNVVRPASP
ncbi:MAG: hypothetical protein U0350_44445 [Caldilineaceae bacterium]